MGCRLFTGFPCLGNPALPRRSPGLIREVGVGGKTAPTQLKSRAPNKKPCITKATAFAITGEIVLALTAEELQAWASAEARQGLGLGRDSAK